MTLTVACAAAAVRRPNAADLNARADLEESRAATASPDEARTWREAATEHRSAAQAIVDREEAICAAIPEAEREHPSFLSQVGIDAVWPAKVERRLIKLTVTELRGADLSIRAMPGMTKQWVARLVRCHIAWLDVVGPRVPEAFENPFLVGTPEISFDEEETGFVIRIRGSDTAEGEQILQRARHLAATPPVAITPQPSLGASVVP